MSHECVWSELEALSGVDLLGYGINRPGRPDPAGVPMLRAGDIGDGRIHATEPMLISRNVDEANPRTRLRPGDVAIVLVGRVGEAACVTREHEGWQAARSLAVVRCVDPAFAEWLRVWLAAPAARAWCMAHATGSAQATLGVTKLRKLPVPLPPPDVRDRTLHAVKVIEARIEVNERIARSAVALADAHFAAAAFDRSTWSQHCFKDVAQARTGASAKPTELLPEGRGRLGRHPPTCCTAHCHIWTGPPNALAEIPPSARPTRYSLRPSPARCAPPSTRSPWWRAAECSRCSRAARLTSGGYCTRSAPGVASCQR